MRRALIGLSILLLCSVAFLSCNNEGKESPAGIMLGGEHQLRRMVESSKEESHFSGAFFLIAGGVSGGTKRMTTVTFAWQMNDGTYAISSLPIEKIRVQFDETKKVPTIKFRWRPWEERRSPQPQELMNRYVIYAVILCEESDWPIKIQLPLD
jgi:hypothetical protein